MVLEKILEAHRVFLPFLDFVQGYGIKVTEEHHNWTGYRDNISDQLSPDGKDWTYGLKTASLYC
jgi:hypothetical protein